MKYYPGIDGLRAIAVIPVILFHLDVPGFTGGYVGVDVFFVISGYLITGHLLQETGTGSLSLAAFYERRARRILPLLVAVMAFSLGVTSMLYEANSFEAVGTGIAGCSTFVSNIIFMRRKGYFDPSVHEDPLLHTWSLSVEEQFYIFLPLFLLLLYRISKNRTSMLLLAVAVCSFVLSTVLSSASPRMAFYSSPTRAWEFLTGSLLATTLLPRIHNKNLLAGASITGLCLVFISIFCFNNTLVYPGMYALVPVLGSAALIYSCVQEEAIIDKLLSLQPVVFTGRISYSLYMWHWPLLVFANMTVTDKLSGVQSIVFLLLLFPVSVLSYYYIEEPIRRKKLLESRTSVFVVSVIALAAFTIAGVMIRRSTQIQSTPEDEKWKSYSLKQKAAPNEPIYYRLGDTNKAPCFLLWGDSHAFALSFGIDSMAKSQHISGYVVTSSAAPPLSGVNIKDRTVPLARANVSILQFIRSHHELRTIILAARWIRYSNNNVNTLEGDSSMTNALQRMVDTLGGMHRNVFVTTPIPELKTSLNKAIYQQKLSGRKFSEFTADTVSYAYDNKIPLKAIYTLHGAGIIPINERLLSGSKYLAEENGRLLYRDFNHLTNAGSIKVAPAFEEALRGCMDVTSQ